MKAEGSGSTGTRPWRFAPRRNDRPMKAIAHEGGSSEGGSKREIVVHLNGRAFSHLRCAIELVVHFAPVGSQPKPSTVFPPSFATNPGKPPPGCATRNHLDCLRRTRGARSAVPCAGSSRKLEQKQKSESTEIGSQTLINRERYELHESKKVGRATPCAPSGSLGANGGAHGVSRPTTRFIEAGVRWGASFIQFLSKKTKPHAVPSHAPRL